MKLLDFEEMLLIMLRNATTIYIEGGLLKAKYKQQDVEGVSAFTLHTYHLIQMFKHYAGKKFEGDVRFTYTDSNELIFELDLKKSYKFEHTANSAINAAKGLREYFKRDSISLIERKLFDFVSLNIKKVKTIDIPQGEMIQVETVEWVPECSFELAVLEWVMRVLEVSAVLTHPQRSNTIYFEFRCYKPSDSEYVLSHLTTRQPTPITVADA